MKNWKYIEGAKTGNSKCGNAEIVKDGNTWVVLYAEGTKSKEFDSKEAADKFAKEVGNTRTGNSYNWEERRGHQELYDPTFPFGGHVRGYVEKTKNGYVGAKTNGSILISKKEFATEEEAKKFVENKQTGNKKVGNANTHLTASNSGELWLNFDGTGEMYDPIELGRYDFSGKSEALSVARELEQLKRKAEQKVKDADKFINAIKQWAAGLK